MKNTDLSEFQECVLLAEYLDLLIKQGKVAQYTHIPNETYTTSWNQKRKNKQMGVNKGFPDYVILTARTKMLLFPEMKKKKGGTVSPEQKLWIAAINGLGGTNVKAQVCKGFDEAKQFIDLHV